MFERLRKVLLGSPRDIRDPGTYHQITLIALLAWVGFGADGLSSSAYGPDEAFRTLGEHTYLAVLLAIATALTVFVISSAYRGIIERFPFGGGGYMVATELLGPGFGVLSGSALLVDYVLTISVSLASGADQLFSILPMSWHSHKLVFVAFVILVLVILNLRGIKESILFLTPIFGLFILTHAILIFGGLGSHITALPRVASDVHAGFSKGLSTIGLVGMAAMLFRAFSMGAGTFTGIEAVSNGLQAMRDPKVETGKRTMTYMSISLAIAAGGILMLYLFFRIMPTEGKTMNAVLLEQFAGKWNIGHLAAGHGFVILTLAAEAALLFVAAQTGFIGGPRVMANMAIDGWLPRRFSQLSDRLTMQDGVLMMGVAALAILFYTHGDVTALVTMYSINVFITFSLSMTGMCRYWLIERKKGKKWVRPFAVQAVGLFVCLAILITVVIEKFERGAWMTILITSTLIVMCLVVRRHYRQVGAGIRKMDKLVKELPAKVKSVGVAARSGQRTAVMMVGGYGGLGIHQFMHIQQLFPGQFRNYVFVSVGIVDSATMQGIEEVERTRRRTQDGLKKYVALAQNLGFDAEYRMSVAADAVEELVKVCLDIHKDYPEAIYFMGRLIFENEGWYHRFLHNETAYKLQRRLHFEGLDAVVLTVRLPDVEDGKIEEMIAGGEKKGKGRKRRKRTKRK